MDDIRSIQEKAELEKKTQKVGACIEGESNVNKMCEIALPLQIKFILGSMSLRPMRYVIRKYNSVKYTEPVHKTRPKRAWLWFIGPLWKPEKASTHGMYMKLSLITF